MSKRKLETAYETAAWLRSATAREVRERYPDAAAELLIIKARLLCKARLL